MDQHKYSLVTFIDDRKGSVITETKKLFLHEGTKHVLLLDQQPNVQLNTLCFSFQNNIWELCAIREFASNSLPHYL